MTRAIKVRSSPFGMLRELGLLGPCGFAGKGERKAQVPAGVRKRMNVKVKEAKCPGTELDSSGE